MKHLHMPIAAIAALGIALGTAGLVSGTAAHAQQEAPAAAPEIDDRQLQAFADATIEIVRIREAYLPKMQSATTVEEQATLREEQMAMMVDAVEAKDLSVEEYNEIQQAYRTDPETAEKIDTYISEKQ